jgi:hypothetical protein
VFQHSKILLIAKTFSQGTTNVTQAFEADFLEPKRARTFMESGRWVYKKKSGNVRHLAEQAVIPKREAKLRLL